MRHRLVAMLLLVCSAPALADPSAVERSSYEVGIASGDLARSGTRLSNSYGVNARATTPLADSFGAALALAAVRTNLGAAFRSQTPALTAPGAPPDCEIDTSSAELDLFARAVRSGRIGIQYGAGQQRARCNGSFLVSGSGSLDTRTIAANAEYYLARVTLLGSRRHTQLDGSADLDAATLAAAWYPTDNLRLALAADGLDLKGSYRFELEYQAPLFGNALSLLLGSAVQDLGGHSITVGISYFFGTRVELMTRDRHYR